MYFDTPTCIPEMNALCRVMSVLMSACVLVCVCVCACACAHVFVCLYYLIIMPATGEKAATDVFVKQTASSFRGNFIDKTLPSVFIIHTFFKCVNNSTARTD